MDAPAISELIRDLGSDDADPAWIQFLERYSPLLQQVILLSVPGEDTQADCFVFVCEQLAANQFRRLRKFRPQGSATFATWLRAVTRNLCLDWQRKVFGRWQPFTWIRSLTALEQQVFRRTYEELCTPEQTLALLAPSFPGVTAGMVEEAANRLGTRLSARERWLLSAREVHLESLDAITDEGDGALRLQVRDFAADPERAAIEREHQASLQRVLAGLSKADQLLLRMRFEHGLTLQEIARIAGFKDAQSADRALRTLLERVRQQTGAISPRRPGKVKTASV
jgi:RNA polymerase sigma factor (sigma-70 family)